MGGLLKRVLIVDDDVGLCRTLALHVGQMELGCEVTHVHSLDEARTSLGWEPTLVLLDVRLPDGMGMELLQQLTSKIPAPVVIAMSGEATAKDAFMLAAKGARAFLAKPIETEELRDAIRAAEARPLAQMQTARALVGVAPIHDVQNSVRKAMIEHALHVTGANRTATARLLSVTRQAVQQMIRDLEIDVTAIETKR